MPSTHDPCRSDAPWNTACSGSAGQPKPSSRRRNAPPAADQPEHQPRDHAASGADAAAPAARGCAAGGAHGHFRGALHRLRGQPRGGGRCRVAVVGRTGGGVDNVAGRRADRLLRRPGAVRAARVQCVPGHGPRRGLVHRSGAAWPLCHRHRRAALEIDAAAPGRGPGLRRQVVAHRDRRTHRRRDAGRLRHGAATPGAGLPRCGAPWSAFDHHRWRRPGRPRAGLAGAGGSAADRQRSRRPDGAAGAQRPTAATPRPTASSPTGAASRRRCRGSGLRREPRRWCARGTQRPPSRFATS